MTVRDVVESTLWSWAADAVLGRPLAELVEEYLDEPWRLGVFASLLGPDEQAYAERLERFIRSGRQPEPRRRRPLAAARVAAPPHCPMTEGES